MSAIPTARTGAAPAAAPRWSVGYALPGRFARAAGPLFVAVLAVGIALRLWSPSALWLDEAQTVAFASLPLNELHGALKTDGAPPLYYVLLHGWLSLLESVGLGGSVWSARSLSMLCSLAALPLTYLMGRRIGGSRRHGEVALLVLAANPWAIRYAGEARMYSLVFLLVLLGILALDWLRRREDALPVLALGAVSAALLLTHYWAIFLLATVGAIALARGWQRPAERALARRVVLALVGGGVPFLPWVPTMLHQSANTGAPWAPSPGPADVARLPVEWGGGTGPAGQTVGLMLLPLILLAVFARRRPGTDEVAGVRPTGASGLLGLVAGGTLALALGVSMATGGAVVGRYTAVVLPLVLLLVAFGILTLPRTAGRVVLSAVVGVSLLAGLTIATTTHSHAGRVADELNARAQPGDLVVYCPDQLAPGIEARLRAASVERLTLPRQSDPTVVDWTGYTDRIDALRLRAVAEEITEVVQTDPDAAIWLVLGADYRTHVDVCEPLRTRLVAALGVPEVLLTGTARGGEKASLERFPR